MAITQDRMLTIISAAEMYQRALKSLANAIHSATALADAQLAAASIASDLNPHLIATVELERRYFNRFGKYNEREKMRQRRRKLGLPGGTGGHVGAAAKRPEESAEAHYATLQAESAAALSSITPEELAEMQRQYDANRALQMGHSPAHQMGHTPAEPRPRNVSDPNVISRSVEWGEGEVTPDQALDTLKDGGSLF